MITSGVVGKQLRLRGYQGEQRQEVMLEPTIISEHFPFLRQGILAGLGVGIASTWAVADALADGRLVHLAPHWSAASLPISLVHPPGRLQPAHRLFRRGAVGRRLGDCDNGGRYASGVDTGSFGAGRLDDQLRGAEQQPHRLARALDLHVYDDAASVMGALVLELGDAYRETGAASTNGSALFFLLAFAREPLPHARLHVREAGGRLAPIVVPGELWVGGAGVARRDYRLALERAQALQGLLPAE